MICKCKCKFLSGIIIKIVYVNVENHNPLLPPWSHPAPGLPALAPRRGAFSLHCSFPSTLMTAPQGTLLWNSWSLQTTRQSSVWSGTVRSLHTDGRWNSWPSGVVRTIWSWTRSRLWRWQWTSGEAPLYFHPWQSTTTRCLLWTPSGFWVLQSPETWSGPLT